MKNQANKKQQLPAHLVNVINKYEAKCKSFGVEADWAYKAMKKAEERGDDFNPIHALVK